MGDAAHALLPSGPQLDPRITLNRSAEVQITDEEGDAFVAHLPNGFVDADGVARGRRGLKPSAYHGCWENTDAIPERITFKAAMADANSQMNLGGARLAVVLSRWSSDFFHWMAEAVPRVVLVSPLLQDDEHARLLLNCGLDAEEPPLSGYINQTLELLKVRRGQVVCHQPGTVYHNAKQLVWPSPTPCGSTQVTALRKLRTRLPVRLRPAAAHDNVVLLYKRPEGISRRMLNHEAVLSALRDDARQWPPQTGAAGQGPGQGAAAVRVFDGSGPTHQQIRLFRGARCLVGPHGAGMVMMLFAPPSYGTAEVTPGAYGWWDGVLGPNKCFRELSAKLSLRHAWAVQPQKESGDAMTPAVSSVLFIARDACGVPLRTHDHPGVQARLGEALTAAVQANGDWASAESYAEAKLDTVNRVAESAKEWDDWFANLTVLTTATNNRSAPPHPAAKRWRGKANRSGVKEWKRWAPKEAIDMLAA